MDISTLTPKDISNIYDDIRPYRDEEIPQAMLRISQDKDFIPIMSFIYQGERLLQKIEEFTSYTKVSEFQIKFMFNAINKIIEKTISNFTYSGFEKLEKGKPYLFISNHRDILLDAALLQIALYNSGLECSEITFGDNLMQPGLVTDFGKSNRMFKVVRKGTASEFYKTSLHLSDYIRYSINKRATSVWIAQRNGRTKDGFDKTNPTVLKMLSLSGDKDMFKNITELNIVPIAISYQWETCIKQKVRELYISKSDKYIKTPGEDQKSILDGILTPKGDVHIQICNPISKEEIADFKNLERNDAISSLANIIDKKIYSGYKLHNTNYIAHDILHNTVEYKNNYTAKEYNNFVTTMGAILESLNGEVSSLRDIYLKIYAYSLDNHIKKK